MYEFIAKHQDEIAGTLSGFDRLVLRGTLRSISFEDGLRHYLHANDVLLKDFGWHVERVSRQLKHASQHEAKQLGRPVTYLNSSQGEQGRDCPRDPCQGCRPRGTDLRADLRGTMLEF